MREIINISLPSRMAKTIKSAVRTGNYASTSEFFRDLIRDWQEGKLSKELNAGHATIVAGKGKTLKSLKDLR